MPMMNIAEKLILIMENKLPLKKYIIKETTIKEIYHFLSELNNIPLENIKWINDINEEIKLTENQIHDYKFTGLSNYHIAKDLFIKQQ